MVQAEDRVIVLHKPRVTTCFGCRLENFFSSSPSPFSPRLLFFTMTRQGCYRHNPTRRTITVSINPIHPNQLINYCRRQLKPSPPATYSAVTLLVRERAISFSPPAKSSVTKKHTELAPPSFGDLIINSLRLHLRTIDSDNLQHIYIAHLCLPSAGQPRAVVAVLRRPPSLPGKHGTHS